jgi:hypothetical protein
VSSAYGVSGDGGVVVGASGNRAFIWTPTLGMRDLQSYLTGLGADLTGWTLWDARGVSADGLTMVGTGRSPSGIEQGWIATIPAPGPWMALGAGALWAARRRRRTGNRPLATALTAGAFP